jgi:PAS domain S-box-containing protein
VTSTGPITGALNTISSLDGRERELADFVENAVLSLHWVDGSGRILWANQAELDLLGYTREEYVGHLITEFHVDGPVIEDILARLHRNERINNREARMRAKDGSIKEVLISSSVLFEEGRFVHTRCFTRDITDRKIAERRLRAQFAVTNALATHDTVDDAARQLIPEVCRALRYEVGALWLIDADALRCRAFWSENGAFPDFERASQDTAFRAGAGLPGRVWQSRRAEWIAEIPSDGNFPRKPYAAGLRSAVGVPIAGASRFYGVLEFLGTETRERDEGELAMFDTLGAQVGLYLDRHAAYQEAQDALRVRDEFLSVATHELRTPVAGLSGFAQLAQRWLQKGDITKTREAIDRILAQSTRVSKLISSLLDATHIQTGKLAITTTDTDLVAVLRSAIAGRAGLDPARVHIRAPEAAMASVDATRIEQVLNNLLDNAIKYSPPDSPIEVAVERSGDRWRLAVRDQGVGVAPEDRDRIFERFYQGGTAARSGGLGLGLYVSREIAQLHGGDLVYEAPEGGGATFVLTVRAA